MREDSAGKSGEDPVVRLERATLRALEDKSFWRPA
jgi:hypothetical protein